MRGQQNSGVAKPQPSSGNPFAEYLKKRQNIVGETEYREVNDNDN